MDWTFGPFVTFWYRCTRHYGRVVVLSDGMEVLSLDEKRYTPGFHVFKSDVDDLRVIGE